MRNWRHFLSLGVILVFTWVSCTPLAQAFTPPLINGYNVLSVNDEQTNAPTLLMNVAEESAPDVNNPPVNNAAPAITGTIKVGQQVTADPGAWSDIETASDSITYNYEWQSAADNSDTDIMTILGTVGNTCTISKAEAHRYIRVKVTAADTDGASTDAYSEWSLVQNTVPVISGSIEQTMTQNEDGSCSLSLQASDVDGDTISWSIDTQAPNGTASVDGSGNVSYTRDEGYTGSDSFTVKADDSKGGSDTVALSVLAIDKPVLNIVSITSNNANKSAAGVGNTITASITSSKDLKASPVIKIAGHDADVAGSGKDWSGTYTMAGSDTAGIVSIHIDYSDTSGVAGDTVTATTDTSYVNFYPDKPVISLNGPSEITLEFGDSYTDPTAAVDVLGKDITGDIEKSTSIDTSAIGTYSVTYNAADAAGNEADPVTRTVHVQPKASNSIKAGVVQGIIASFTAADFPFSGDSLASIMITAVPSHGKLVLKEADTETEIAVNTIIDASILGNLIFKPDDVYTGSDSLKWTGTGALSIESNEATVAMNIAANAPPSKPNSFLSPLSGQSYKGEGTIDVSWEMSVDPEGGNVNYVLEFSSDGTSWDKIYSGADTTFTIITAADMNTVKAVCRVKAIDAQGLESAYTTSGTFAIDSTAPMLLSVSISSSNLVSSLAKVDDYITVKITSDEDLASKPVIKIAGKDAAVSGDKTVWTGVYRMTDSDAEGTVSIAIDYFDIVGNAGVQVTVTTDGTGVTFDRTKPVISLDASDITILVGSVYTDWTTANDGSGVDLTGSIDKSGDVVNTGTVGTYVITYNVKDDAGNAADPVTKTIHVQPIASDSEKSGIVGNIPAKFTADEFELNGDTTESIMITTLPVAGELKLNGVAVVKDQVIPITEMDKLNYLADNIFAGDDTVKYDSLSWEGVGSGQVYSNKAAMKLTIAKNLPPSNLVSIKGVAEGQRFKEGQIDLSWDASKDSDGDSSKITYTLEYFNESGWNTVYTGSSNSFSFSVTSQMNNDSARFRVKATDQGGIDSEYTESAGFIIDNEAPTLGSVTIKSSSNTSYAKTGNTITIDFTPSETLSGTPVVKIAGKDAEVTFDGTDWTASYTMTDTDVQGIIQFSIDFTDLTGIPGLQVTTSSDLSQIIYDRTKPVISLNGLSEVTVEAKTSYSDGGASASDNQDSSAAITAQIKSTGAVNIDLVGDYTITYDVTDSAGNAAIQVTRTVHVVDTTKPVISLKGSSETTIQVHSIYDDAGATASDTYDGDLTVSILVDNPVDKDVVGSYTVTYNVTDSNGNDAVQVTRKVNVVDTTKPIITITPDVDGYVDITIEVGSEYTDLGATAKDNYDSDAVINARIVTSGFVNTAVVGEYTINYDVTDTNGNIASQATRTVNVKDTQKPVITLTGGDVTIQVHDLYNDEGATALDNYDGDLTGKIVVNNPVKANVVGTYTVTYDVKDSSGNSSLQVTRTVKVEDTTPPVITLKGVTLDGNSDITIQVHGAYDDTIAKNSATATDNYDGDLSSKITVINPVDPDIVGDYTVTFNVTDANGNAADPVTRTVHVVDTIKPVITLNGIGSITITLGTAYTDAGAVVTDNYDADRSITGTGAVDINKVGTYTISFNAEDANNNIASTVNRSVHVVDLTPPVITLAAGEDGKTDYTLEVHSNYVEPGYTATDNYDGDIHNKVVISNPVIVDKVGDYTVTYNVKDASNNPAVQVTRTVHVVDTTRPVITLKGNNIISGLTDVYVEANTQYDEPGYTATDNYDGDLTSKITVSGTVDVTKLGDYMVYYDVTDANGNSAVRATRTVHVVDTIKPTLTLNGSTSISVAQGETYTDSGVTVSDNYETQQYLSDNLVITVNGTVTNQRPVTLIVPGTYIIIYNVSDSSGNAAEAVRRTVYVSGGGGTGPSITVIPGEDESEVKTPYNIMTGVTAKDHLGNDITGLVTATITDPDLNTTSIADPLTSGIISFSKIGDYMITYHVIEDGVGSDSEIRLVHVVDKTKPVLTLKGSETVNVEVHHSYTDDGASAADNYDDSAVLSGKIFVKNSVVIDELGTYTVTYNVTDANGNKADEITRTVNVVDTTSPVITLLGLAEITLEAKGTYSEPGAIATDNYDKSCTVQISGTLDTDTVGDYVLTYSATDAHGNKAADITRTIHVKDTIRPVITLNGSSTVTLEVHNNYVELGATAFDAYDNASVAVSIDASGLNKDVLGYYTIRYTAADSHGNTATIGRTIHVVDTTKPVITLLGQTDGSPDVILEVHTKYVDATATALDNYDGDLTKKIFVVNPVISDKVGTYQVTYTVSDANNNTATAVRNVSIVDTTKPVITISGSSVLTIQIGSAYSDAGATASDNYDGDITGKIQSAGTVDTTKVGEYKITYDVKDVNNNNGLTKTRTVYVQPKASNVSKPGVQNVQMKFIFDEFSSKLSGDTPNLVKIVTLPSNGMLKYNGANVIAGDTFDSTTIGGLIYIPNTDRVGKDSFNWSAVGAAEIWSNNAAVNFDIVPNIPPTTPGSFTGFTAGQAFKGGTDIIIGWGASSDPDGNLGYLIDYVLEFSKDDGKTWSSLDIITVNSYTYTLPKENISSARFRVKAKDAGGNVSTYQTSFAFTIDSKAPLLTSVKISSNNGNPSYAKVGEEVTVTFTSDEPLSTSPSVTIAGHNAAVAGNGNNWTGKFVMTDTDTEGQVSFTVDFSDLVGNDGTGVSAVTDSSKVIFDSTKPKITILGSSTLTISYGSTYNDAGASASDNIDGTITGSITVNSTVINSVGTYSVTYNVKDSAGNVADTAARTVIVQPKASNSTKAGVENITLVFILNDFALKYANDTLSTVTISALPSNGILKYKGQTVTGSIDIPKNDIDAGLIVYIPNPGFIGLDSIKWTAAGSKNIISTEAAMSLDIKQNNPPTMPGPITGISAGQKVKGGSSVTLSWGASSDTDNGGAALVYILESTTDGSTWTQIYSGTALTAVYTVPVKDVDKAQFRVKAKDAGGFMSEYRDSGIYIIDSTPPVLTVINISSNNADTSLAKTTNVITVSFEADEDLSSLPVVTIAGRNATVTGSGKVWTAKCTMVNTDEEGTVKFTIDYKDVAGNAGIQAVSTLDASSVVFDRTNPVLTITGQPKLTTPFGTPYNDAGASATDSREGDISGRISADSTVDINTVGYYTVTYRVSDSAGNSASSVIRDVDVAPRADNGSITALENIPYGFLDVNFTSCFKGDTLNGIRITSLPGHGILKDGSAAVNVGDDISNINNLTYIPDAGYHGDDSFTWNGMGTIGIRSTEGEMSIKIEENYPPSVPGAFTGITQGKAFKGGTDINVQFGASTDADGDRGIPMKYVLEFTSDGETWTQIYTGTGISFTHSLGMIDTDKAQYRVKAIDGGNLSSGYTCSDIFVIDSTKPVITLKGLSETNTAVHYKYTDLGATATDNHDSSDDITKKITVVNKVDSEKIGDYTVTYDVQDSCGNKADTVTRTVHVIEDKAQLYGKVTEQDTGNAISNAKVSLYDMSDSLKHQTTTDADGNYVFNNVVLGQYKLVVEDQGYSTKNIGIKLLAENVTDSKIKQDVQLVDFMISLTSNPSSIIGDGTHSAAFSAYITDKDNKPISGITVSFSAELGTFPDGTTAVTGSDGRCSVVYMSEKIEGIESKQISVKAEVNDINRNLHASNEIVITYEPSVVKGVVVDNNTKAKIKGAVVEVSKDFNNDGIVDFYASYVTGENGEYIIAVPRGNVDYDIKITKPVSVNGTTMDMTFNQSCSVDDVGSGNTEYNSENTIAGLILYEQPDGNTQQLSDYSKYEIKVTETDDSSSVVQSNLDDGNGVFEAEGLKTGKSYTVTVTYDMGNGVKINVGTAEVTVSDDGLMSISTILIDPYGVITDASAGAPISGATVTLVDANTGNIVPLPAIADFPPNKNANPQTSNSLGKYAFMVPPGKYNIKASMTGYWDYTSPLITVIDEVVQFNFSMTQIVTGGGSGGSDSSGDTTGTGDSGGTGGSGESGDSGGSGDSGDSGSTEATITRLAGQQRVDTAIEIAKATYKEKVKYVIIATSENYPDALAGSVLAYKLQAPILLVSSDNADQEKVLGYIKEYMERTGTVYILGGTGAVNAEMERKLTSSGFVNVVRLGGIDRYETAMKIVDELDVKKGTPIVIASGENYPDALSISSTAAIKQYPIFLVKADSIDNCVKNMIAELKPERIFVIGLQGAVSDEVQNIVQSTASLDKSNVVRIGGVDRYETSLKVAGYFDFSSKKMCAATGNNFPDIIAGGVYAAVNNSPVILVDNSIPEDLKTYIRGKKINKITIFGGEGAVSKSVEDELSQVITEMYKGN